MKNQYFGDVGDYGKYAMLRYLANDGIKIAVNWYLTPDDGSNDGKFTTYLEKGDISSYDKSLFELLKEMEQAYLILQMSLYRKSRQQMMILMRQQR